MKTLSTALLVIGVACLRSSRALRNTWNCNYLHNLTPKKTMGHQTSFKLEAAPVPVTSDPAKAIYDLVRSNKEAAYCLCEDGEPNESGKWYDHERDLRAHSKKYPDLLFTLSGEGEEAGDVWKKYFVNGRTQVAQAEIRIEDFDPRKLS